MISCRPTPKATVGRFTLWRCPMLCVKRWGCAEILPHPFRHEEGTRREECQEIASFRSSQRAKRRRGARIVYPPRGETQTNDSLFCSGSRATTAQEQTLARAAGWIKESSLHSTDTHPDPYRRGEPSVKISELYSVQSNNEKSPTAQWVSATIKKGEEDGSIRSAGDALSLAQRAGF